MVLGGRPENIRRFKSVFKYAWNQSNDRVLMTAAASHRTNFASNAVFMGDPMVAHVGLFFMVAK